MFHGANRIGLVKGPDNNILLAIDNVLAPHSLSAKDLGWCTSGSVDIFLGKDHAQFLARDDGASARY